MISRSDSLTEYRRNGEAPVGRAPAAGAAPKGEQPAHRPAVLVVDDYLQIDLDRNEVWAGGKKVSLTPTEYRLLYQLVSQPGRVLSFERLLTSVWGWEYRDEDHYVRLYISYLRQKLEPDPAHPRYILTEKGLGYRFVDYRQGRHDAAGRAAEPARPAEVAGAAPDERGIGTDGQADAAAGPPGATALPALEGVARAAVPAAV